MERLVDREMLPSGELFHRAADVLGHMNNEGARTRPVGTRHDGCFSGPVLSSGRGVRVGRRRHDVIKNQIRDQKRTSKKVTVS